MDSRILGLFSALCLMSAPIWAKDPTECCLGNIFTATVNMNQGMKFGNGGQHDLVQNGEGTQYADLNKGWFVTVFDMKPGGQVTIYQEVDSDFMYLKVPTDCIKMKTPIKLPRPPFCWFNQTGGEFKGTETLGNSEVEVWQMMDKSSGFHIKQHVSVFSPGKCFPIYQTMSITAEGYALSQGILLTNFKDSIDDPSVLNFPDECKDAVLTSFPASGAQVNMMSALALVAIFVLHTIF